MNKNILKLLNERPIAYYPLYKDLMGSTAGGVVLSQLMYWFAKKDKFYKTDQEIMQETKVGVGELKSSKKQLKTLDFIKITLEGIPAKTYYKVDWELYEYSLLKLTKQVKQDKQELPNSVNNTNQAITKTTTKKEREGNFYEQHKNGIMLFIDESIKQEKDIRSEQGYKKTLIDKFMKEDAATIELYSQWTKKHNVELLIKTFKGQKYKITVKGITKIYLLKDIEYNHFEFIALFENTESSVVAHLRVTFKTFEDIKNYLSQECIKDAN